MTGEPHVAVRPRRATIVALIVAVFLSVAAVLTSGVARAEPPRPNIVVILADDLDSRTTDVWQAMPRTARLLRGRGMEFTNSFAPMPICCAARSSLLTGKYGHNTGVLTNAGPVGGFDSFVRNGNERSTIATYLQGAGYRTGMAGKYLNGLENSPAHIPPGWDDWNAGVTLSLYTGYGYTLNENGRMVPYGIRPDDYETDVVARKSVDFIRASAHSGKPFFWYAASTAPHFPLPAAPRHLASSPWTPAHHLPNFQEADVSDKPSWLIDTAGVRAATIAATNDLDNTNRLGSLKALDEMVEAIVGELSRTGQLDNTYLVFTSDNGYSLGAHRLTQKMVPYEESIRIPLVITGPGVRPARTSSMATTIDLMPTILTWAGIPIPNAVDGQSLTPVLAGGGPVRRDFLAEYGGAGALGLDGIFQEPIPGRRTAGIYAVDVPSYVAVRSDRYLYVRWYERERPLAEREYELYDLRSDPWQLTNLIKTPAGRERYAVVVAQLDHRLAQLDGCSGDGCR
ncbi:sulfatase family protein [Gordonia rhizosphera]|uniref:sulfatase family protein n=1 Tax=Gordonia rhizosphera TaxID=83341 RepID=UPI00031A5BC5|nr:sulfatase [Gordonia rhizosphera]